MSYHHLVIVLALGIVSLLVAGDIVRRTPKSLLDLSPTEQRRACRDLAIALLILIDAVAIAKYGLIR